MRDTVSNCDGRFQGHHKVNQVPLDELSDVPGDNNPAVDDKLALSNSQMMNALSPQDASAVSAVAAVRESSVAAGCHQQCIQHYVSRDEGTTTQNLYSAFIGLT